MTGPENFLTRWSRRKQDAEREQDLPNAAATDELGKPVADDAAAEKKEIEFDISTLPSLDSITAGTDMRVFMQKGVPLELARAALRRAWTADPAIRDFIEVAENQWDFATGSDIPGFGPLEPSEEIRQMVEAMFQAPTDSSEPESSSKTETAEEQNAALQQSASASGDEESGTKQGGIAEGDQTPRHPENVAAQHEDVVQNAAQGDALPARKRHGSALPE